MKQQLKRSVTSGENKRKQSPVTSRLFAYQVPQPPFTLSKFAKTSFLNFKIGDSALISQKTYHKDMTLLSRRSRQLLCHQCNCFPLRLQMLPVKSCNQSGRVAVVINVSKLMKNYLRICHKTANLTTEIRKCRLIAKHILLETLGASYFALHLRTYLHHYE